MWTRWGTYVTAHLTSGSYKVNLLLRLEQQHSSLVNTVSQGLIWPLEQLQMWVIFGPSIYLNLGTLYFYSCCTVKTKHNFILLVSFVLVEKQTPHKLEFLFIFLKKYVFLKTHHLTCFIITLNMNIIFCYFVVKTH